MKISVIIPTYKPKNYLWECLDSISNQTLQKQDYEVIIILNGSLDPWMNLIAAYIEDNMKEVNVRFIHTEKSGVSNARNMALDLACGEYITFIDDDDYVSSSYLKDLLNLASKDTISLCYPLSFKDGEKKCEPFYITKDYIPAYTNKSCPWYKARRFFNGPVYKLIHREIIGDRRFDIRFNYGEDSLFMFLISNRFKRVSFAPTSAVYYRRVRSDSAMTTKKSLAVRICNEWRLLLTRTTIFLSQPAQYSIRYYVRSFFSSIVKLIIN